GQVQGVVRDETVAPPLNEDVGPAAEQGDDLAEGVAVVGQFGAGAEGGGAGGQSAGAELAGGEDAQGDAGGQVGGRAVSPGDKFGPVQRGWRRHERPHFRQRWRLGGQSQAYCTTTAVAWPRTAFRAGKPAPAGLPWFWRDDCPTSRGEEGG